MSERKSTREYWDENWRIAGNGLNVGQKNNYFWYRLDKAFKSIFPVLDSKSNKLIEIGAGSSEWLPRLSHEYHFKVSGLDYSEVGCERARQILSHSGIDGNIYCGDMFSPPEELLMQFNIVCSFGLVEHFTNTAEAIRACAKFATPGAIILTLIPNMTGLNGFLYKTFNRRVFDTHVPLNLEQLRQAHVDAGLQLYFSSYLLSCPSVIDATRNESRFISRWLRNALHRLSLLIWWFEERGIGVPENKVTSPYMICAARVPMSEK